jgi:photosystem II stability/assembly factor-like uncharacterized protein
MKKMLLLLIICLLTFCVSKAQSWTKVFSGAQYTGTSIYFTDVNTGYIAATNGTIFKTTDAGISWNSINTGTTTVFTAIRFTNSNTGYVCSGDGKILKTTDSGVTWKAVNSGTVSNLSCIYFTDENTGYITGTGGLILKTTDAGNNWVKLTSGITQNYLKSIYFTDQNTGFAVGDGIILKTVNAGINWTSIASGTTLPLNSIYFTSSNIGYIAGAGVMLKTVDSGNNWSLTTSNYYIKSIYFTDANTGYVSGEYRFNTTSYICLGKTTNAGATWVYTNSDPTHLFGHNSIFFADKNNGYSVGDNVVSKTSNAGIDWESEFFGNPEPIKSVFFTDEKTGYNVCNPYRSGKCLIRKTVDGGKNWSIIHRLNDTNVYAVHFTNPNTGYVLTSSKIYKTINAGSTWTTTTSPNDSFFTSIYFTDANTVYVTSAYGRIYKTIDGGNKWSLLFAVKEGATLKSIFFIDDRTGFVAGYNNTNDIIYKTNDGGNNWTQITFSTKNYLNSITFTSAKIGICVGGGGVPGGKGVIYRSSDLGKTWTLIDSGNNGIAENLSVCFADDNIGYITGSNGKILKSTDAGITWTVSNNVFYASLFSLNFPGVYTGYAVGNLNTVLKYENCNGFTANLTQTNVKCYGANIGSASVTVKGGTAPFTYLWSNGQTTPTISGLSPGLYSVTVKMAGQECPITKSVTITGPTAPLSANIAVTPNTKCTGICDGALTLNVTGGTAPYRIKWDANANNQTIQTITGLCSGKYTVIITDANNCTLLKEVILPSTSNFDSQVYLTNIAAVDQVNVSPAFTSYYAYNLPSSIAFR